ncbi:3-oxoacyl-[acyl-carrier-protein] synthase III C-terminal domain-containing protein [Lentzea albida]|uniref:3-oxoacyl-[acyl-carrier-protein] synthase-3 n=1 Tax=Lentzea albida TaxID=65499 RepID=A0A1H9WRC2_9PSEU|nr:3-oxoacyl-[acyl-carrier-protein] synthase III C-terminal domain-containing protein [Lentzea albida]SES36351.1 3-oxoacyl-[acyl-carrier-protein] synthase-3 [Lentzea albida]
MRVSGRVCVSAATTWLPAGRSRAADAVAAGTLSDIDARSAVCHEVAVADGQQAWQLGLEACREVLSTTGTTPEEVEFLAYAGMSATDEDPASPAHRLAAALETTHAVAVGVNQMSSGGDAALHAAITTLLTEPGTRHALACTGTNTRDLPYDRWRTAPEVVLGDGGTAALLHRDRGPLAVLATGRAGNPRLEGAFPRFHPFRPLPPALDHSAALLEFRTTAEEIRITVATAVRQALTDADLQHADRVEVVCTARLRPQTIRYTVLPALPEAARDRLVLLGDTTGHLGAGDTIANLADLLRLDSLTTGGRALLVGLGAGFTATALVVERR